VLVGLENIKVDFFDWSPGCLAKCARFCVRCFVKGQVCRIEMLLVLLDFLDIFDRDFIKLILEHLDAG
jgi:hypothetical protein